MTSPQASLPLRLTGELDPHVPAGRAVADSSLQSVVGPDNKGWSVWSTEHGAETMRRLRELAKEEGTRVVIVSYDERLRDVADRVL